MLNINSWLCIIFLYILSFNSTLNNSFYENPNPMEVIPKRIFIDINNNIYFTN
jgi:hypothetical protein